MLARKHFADSLTALLVVWLVILPGGPVKAVPLSAFMTADAPPVMKTYKQVGPVPLEYALFYPPGWKAEDKRPAVVFIHGGAWVAGDNKSFYPQARYFASRGAVTMSVEYRLEQAVGSSLENCFADCKSALRYIRAHAPELGVDPEKIAAFGDSAGGHLAAALGTCGGFDDPSDDLKVSAIPDALVLCNPIVDLTDPAWIKNVIRGDAMQKGRPPGDPAPTEEQRKLALSLSPLANVKLGQPPALLMHGTKDTIVDPEQARKFAEAYTRAGNRCELVWIPDARHAFIAVKYTAPENVVVDAIRRADAFLGSLGWLEGDPTLEVSDPPAWEKRK